MSMNVNDLNSAIVAVCPITGVSVGDWNDKGTWRIDFSAGATPSQRTAAQAVVTNWSTAGLDNTAAKVADMTADPTVIALVLKLQSSTSAQIDTYFANNVTTAAQAIGVLKAVIKILAYALKGPL